MTEAVRYLPILVLLLIPRSVVAQEVSGRARVDSTNYLVGDVITIHIDATHPKAVALKVAVGDTIAGFAVLDRSPFEVRTETTSSATLRIAKYDSGTAVLPPLEILYSLPRDTVLRIAVTNPLVLTVHTLAVDTSKAFKDVKPPLSIPLTLAEIALYVGIILLLAGLVYLLHRYWKKKQQKMTGEVYVPPPRPAHIVALEQLAILKEQRLWQRGLVKQYYSQASEIIRRYVENRFNLMALEQTTDEIMYGMKHLEVQPRVCSAMETLLRLSDLVKFAKYQPGVSEHEEILTLAFDIVQTTQPAESKVPVQTGQKVTADVEF